MNGVLRLTRISVAAALLATSVAGVSAAEHNATATHQAQYSRWHDSAVAFAETLDKLAERYTGLQATDKAEALRLIAQSEQSARRQDFNMASQQARQAYELLRSSITMAVMHPGMTRP